MVSIMKLMLAMIEISDQLMETYRDQLRSYLEETIGRRPAT